MTSTVILAIKKAAEDEIAKSNLTPDEKGVATRRLANYCSNPDGSAPCPFCFIRGQNNLLSPVAGGSIRCGVCGFVIARHIS
jgi:hypothetical protein